MDINLSTGIFPPSQIPLDSKAWCKEISDISSLGANNYKAFYYYDGLIIYCIENKKSYEWREVVIPGDEDGLLEESYVYPLNSVTNGIDYSGRIFNFFLKQLTVEEIYNFQTEVSKNEDIISHTTNITSLSTIVQQLTTDVYEEGNQLIQKGFIYISGLTWEVFAQKYIFDGTTYTDLVTETITLETAPTTEGNKRFDVIVFNNDFTFSVLKGEEGVNPAIPTVDITTQIKLTTILVEANMTELEYVTELQVFNENEGVPNEFNTTATGSTIEIGNEDTSYIGSKSIYVELPERADSLYFNKEEYLDIDSIETLSFRIKNVNNKTNKIYISGYNNIEKYYQGSTLVYDGRYGFDIENITDWQLVVIPISNFTASGMEITGFSFSFFGSQEAILYIDDVKLQGAFTESVETTAIPEYTLSDLEDEEFSLLKDGEIVKTISLTDYLKKENLPTYTYAIEANQLKVYKDGVAIVSLDLSMYLDDTNLARLVNGVLDSSTGIATFTRDDETTFTLDLSSLIDVQPTTTSQLENTGSDGSDRYVESKEVNIITATSDIKLTPSYMLPSTTQDVVIEAKGINENTVATFGLGVTVNSQTIELNKFSSLILRCNVTVDATEASYDVTLNNGIETLFSGVFSVINGTLMTPQITEWENTSGSILLSEGKVELESDSIFGSSQWNKEIDITTDFEISFKRTFSNNATLQTYKSIKLFEFIDLTNGDNYSLRIAYNANEMNRYDFLINDVSQSSYITGYLIDDVIIKFVFNSDTSVMSVYIDDILKYSYPNTNFQNNVKAVFNVQYYFDVEDIVFIDFSNVETPTQYNDNYLVASDLEPYALKTDLLNFPQTYLEELIPDSYLPDTTGDIQIIGSYFTESMCLDENINSTNGILIESQTINYATFYSSQLIKVNVTTGSDEGDFDITLNNGSGAVTNSDALLIVLGEVFKPIDAEWTLTEPINTNNDIVNVETWNSYGEALWSKSFDYTKDWSLRFKFKRSPLGDPTAINEYHNPHFLLENASDGVEKFIWNIKSESTGLTKVEDWNYFSNAWKAGSWLYFTPNETNYLATEEIIFEYRLIAGIMYAYKNGSMYTTYGGTITEDLKLRIKLKTFDITDIKYIELAT